MAESTSSQLQRLQLSAADLKRITAEIKPGDPWPDALIEDYLNILRDLVLLADEIDQNAGEIISSINRAFGLINANKSMSAQNRARINALGRDVEELNSRVEGVENEIDGLFNFFPVKALSFAITGNGVSNPTVVHSYNATSISRTSSGTYGVILTQSTINGQNIDARATYAIEHKIAASANTSDFRVEVDSFLGSALIFKVYEVTVGAGGAGSDLVYTLYDLQTGDIVTLNILMNAGDGSLPPT
jgi:hypothetical protein